MNIDQIIGKMMGNSSMHKEKSALESWKKEAIDNIQALKDIKKIASMSDTLNGYQDFDEDSAWERFEHRLEMDVTTIETRVGSPLEVGGEQEEAKVMSFYKWTKVAAVVVVLIGALFVFRNTSSTDMNFVSQEYTSNDLSKDINLDDGTKIKMDKSTKLKVTNDRSVSMKGRAFFNITKDKKNPFTIRIPVGDITVLGTRFTVVADSKTTEIYVEEGSVKYQLDNRTFILVAGDLVRVNNNDVEKTKIKDDNYASWKNDQLIFRDNNMMEVIHALSRHFGRDLKLSNAKKFENCNVMNIFKSASLEEILNDLTKTHGLKYERRGKQIVVVSSKC